MAKIYKYELQPGEKTRIECVEVLSALEQDGKIVVYVVDSKVPNMNQSHFFYVVGTGWDLDKCQSMKFLNTIKCGIFVWHVFYRGKGV